MAAVELPGGGVVLARGLRRHPAPDPPPDFGLYLLGHPLDRPGLYGRHIVGLRPWSPPWPHDRVDWPDLRAPRSPGRTRDQLADVRHRIRAGQRVEIACAGGRGRTGTALAALAILDGLSTDRAVAWVRSAYDPRAVETRAQHRFLVRLARARPAP